jgi:hypothetical protein
MYRWVKRLIRGGLSAWLSKSAKPSQCPDAFVALMSWNFIRSIQLSAWFQAALACLSLQMSLKKRLRRHRAIYACCRGLPLTPKATGYGRGYYDRYLEGFGGVTVGLCRSQALSPKRLPRGLHDIKTMLIVTEKEIIRP